MEGALKMQDWKMHDWNLADQIAGLEIAGLENAGPENAGPESDELWPKSSRFSDTRMFIYEGMYVRVTIAATNVFIIQHQRPVLEM